MELIINIDDKDYEALNKVGNNGLEFNDTLEGRVYRVIANGTPLPKGHGELIDRDKLIPKIHGVKSIVATLDAPTIVEADESEDNNGLV